eukprot:3700695-Pyramimonas_sp.AAC.1
MSQCNDWFWPMVGAYLTPQEGYPPPEVLEIGSGKGRVVLDLLARHPGANVTGQRVARHYRPPGP